MNTTEERRLLDAVTTLLGTSSVHHFQYDLKDLVTETKINLPRRYIFSTVSDMLTLTYTVKAIGNWVIAEIEGTKVQFSRLSENLDSKGKNKDLSLIVEDVDHGDDDDGGDDSIWDEAPKSNQEDCFLDYKLSRPKSNQEACGNKEGADGDVDAFDKEGDDGDVPDGVANKST